MANPTTQIDLPARIEATTAARTITLNPDRFYEARHTGFTNAGATAVGDIFFSCERQGKTAATPVAAYTEGDKRGTIVSGAPPIPIGPGIEEFKFITASGSPTFDLLPSGTVNR
ncbi:MAG: hypothetical protein AB7I42_24230 [Bradyrhizobium sp.]|uniref:hypothetical protein n=1 Tax=Bradyrhizobium sp. TaxID=376 RepID=UPI003D13CEE1